MIIKQSNKKKQGFSNPAFFYIVKIVYKLLLSAKIRPMLEINNDALNFGVFLTLSCSRR